MSDACGRRKRGYAAAPDASTHTVSLDLNHSQAAWRGLNATPRCQAPPCVVASLTPPAKQQRAVREALNPAINATGWRQCGGPTGVSQLNNPQHNPQRRAFSLNLNTKARAQHRRGRSQRLNAALHRQHWLRQREAIPRPVCDQQTRRPAGRRPPVVSAAALAFARFL